MDTKTIEEVHFHNKIWLNELLFYKEELKILREQLEEFASKFSTQNIGVSIEQFQNKFIIHRNELDKLERNIHVVEDKSVSKEKKNVEEMDEEGTQLYMTTKNGMEQFITLYKEMKDDFYKFLSKLMKSS